MTREEILNTPEIVDFMIDKSVMVDSKMKLHKRLDELCKLAIKALEQEPCEDCISRQAVLDDLEKSHMTSGVHNQGTWNECVDSMIHTVRSMPSVNPQEPVLDKIRAEIQAKYESIPGNPWRFKEYDDGWVMALEYTLEVIDKHIGKESE